MVHRGPPAPSISAELPAYGSTETYAGCALLSDTFLDVDRSTGHQTRAAPAASMAADSAAQQRVAVALEEISSHGGPSPDEHEHLGPGPATTPWTGVPAAQTGRPCPALPSLLALQSFIALQSLLALLSDLLQALACHLCPCCHRLTHPTLELIPAWWTPPCPRVPSSASSQARLLSSCSAVRPASLLLCVCLTLGKHQACCRIA